MNAIEVDNIVKKYGAVTALKGITLSVGKNELFGLIGPDGAGKSSLFRIIATLINPDSGKAFVDGVDVSSDYRKVRSIIGYMPGKFSLYQDLTVEENINFFASLFGVTLEENYDLVAPIYKQIEPFKNRRAGRLSGGMKQKLALSCALIHKPSVLLLDEPTTGVDAVSRSEFWDMLSELRRKGISILVSTPYMDEASRCDRIALINDGSILAINTPSGIVDKYDFPLYSLTGSDKYSLLKSARAYGSIKESYPFGDSNHVVPEPDFNAEDFEAKMHDSGLTDARISKIRPGIEDVFIKLMHHE